MNMISNEDKELSTRVIEDYSRINPDEELINNVIARATFQRKKSNMHMLFCEYGLSAVACFIFMIVLSMIRKELGSGNEGLKIMNIDTASIFGQNSIIVIGLFVFLVLVTFFTFRYVKK